MSRLASAAAASLEARDPSLRKAVVPPFVSPLVALLAALALAACGGGSGTQAETAREQPAEQLHPDIVRVYSDPAVGRMCKPAQACNTTVRIDCGIEVDGPLYYFDGGSGKLLMVCGGACMLPGSPDPTQCKACPPPAWTCPP